jgi:hypothetical protein
MTWFVRARLAVAIIGGVLTLLAAFAGGFFMALGNASDSGGDAPPPMPWPQSAYFPTLLVAAGLAIACAAVMYRWPRLAAVLGFCAIGLGVAANVVCTYDVGACVSEWLIVTLPLLCAAVLGLFGRGESSYAARVPEPDVSVLG